MTKPMRFKQYGEWLFEDDRSSIIYEKRNLDEGVGSLLADVGQATLAFIGGLPPLEATGAAEAADALNAGIYFSRGDYINALFSLISVAPVIGDLIGKNGMILNFLRRMRSAGGMSETIVNWIARNSSRVLSGLRTLKTWVANNKKTLKEALRSAQTAFEQARQARQSNVVAEEVENSGITSNDVDFGDAVQPIFNFITSHADRFERYFRNSSIIQALIQAVDQLQEVFEDAIRIIEEVTGSDGGEEAASPEGAVSEITLSEQRFKKLAGLLRD